MNIYTLIPDINHMVGSRNGWFTHPIAREFSDELSKRLVENLAEKDRVPRLRLSQMGPRCPRALWSSLHTPELAEPLPASARIKYSYGHILEALVLAMAKGAGHTVTGEQDELVLDGIVGHRDCVLDGCIVDVKSASSRSFIKFKDRSIAQADDFGYLDQLDAYILASRDDPSVTVKDRGFLLAIDKQLGHMVLYEHLLREDSIRRRIATAKQIASLSEPPECECNIVPDGKSGNLKLDTKASYNIYKHACRPGGIRTFLYSDGPRFLTKVVRLPDVTEVDKHGKIVYHPLDYATCKKYGSTV